MYNENVTNDAMMKIKNSVDLSKIGGNIVLIERIINRFIQGENEPNDRYKSLRLFQFSAPFTEDENYPFKYFNILEHKDVWIEQLKGYMNHADTEAAAIKGEVLPKIFYHILYQYNMIAENTHWISDGARVNVQKIHDLEMPSSYFYELRDLINGLEIPGEAKEESDAI